MNKKLFLTLTLVLTLCTQQASANINDIKPWTFWYWMFGKVSDEGIRADLKAMKEAGIGGFYLMPIKDSSMGPQYGGDADQLSENWWRHIDTVYHTADSLGLEMGIHICDGFALAGGPWIKEEESMQKIVWSDTIINGGEINAKLTTPKHYGTYYEDIAVYAYPARYHDNRQPKVSVQFPFKSAEPTNIIFSYEKPYTLRSVKVITGGNNYQAHRWEIYSSQDGKHFQYVSSIEPARQGWQNTDEYATYSIPATKARYFKFHWTPVGSDPGSEDMDAAKWKPTLKVANLILSSEPIINGYEGKSGAVWRVSPKVNHNEEDFYDKNEVIDITAAFKDGTLKTKLGKGAWHILRMGHASTGHINATGGGGKGLECDKFSRKAVQKQFDNWFAKIYARAPQDVAKRVLRYLHVDSWECGSQNWGENFVNEFQKRRGYNLLPYLPLYAGVPITSVDISENILRDIRATIAELICDAFFNEVNLLAKKYNCKLSTECVAPTMVSDGMAHYRYADAPMGEFWLNSPTHDKPNDMLDAISGAHIYGKKLIQAEGFTEVRGTWDETPKMLKSILDRAFCMGINKIVYHVNTHNPFMDRQPGMTLDGIGTFFQRDNTWWKEMKDFSQYIFLCQGRLQDGDPVVDLAVYTGDEYPRRSLLPERLIETLPGLFGKENIEKEKVRWANVGQPMEISPVGVNHTKNQTKADMFTNPLHGYKYDSFNHDALKTAHVEDGELVTAEGMHYKALIIPQAHKLNPDNITTCNNEIERLKAQGLKVITTPWTESDLTSIGIPRDANLPEGLDFAHRTSKEEDNYFIANLTQQPITFAPEFRVKRKFTYLMYPMLNRGFTCPKTITLAPQESVLLILRDEELDSEIYRPNREESGITLNNWNIDFEKTDVHLTTDKLFDWAEQDDIRLKYYSGHATYSTTFDITDEHQPLVISLGDVYDIATVFVNGEKCGTAWTPPYEVEITPALRKGKNEIKILLVNTWANALLGNDMGTPPFDGIWTNGNFRRADKKPIPAGLLGPVRLLKMKE